MRIATSLAALALALASAPAWGQAALPTALDRNGHPVQAGGRAGDAFALTRLKNGVQFRLRGTTKTLLFYSPTTLRVNVNGGENYWKHPSLAVIDTPDAIPFRIVETAGSVSLRSARLRVDIDRGTGALTFRDAAGRLYTREDQASPQTLQRRTISGKPTYEVQNSFTLKPDEAIYGFGFLGEGVLNRRNTQLRLVQTNIGIVIPVMVSTERYGILWDIYSEMRFKDDAGGASLWAESAPGGVDYYFMAGTTMDEVIAQYRGLTGKAPMFPKQAFGLFMSKERYPTQDRITEVAREFRRHRFPLDYIVQDWQYWGGADDGSWSGMTWDPQRFPEPEKMIDQIHGLNLKLMVSIWPSVGNDTALAHELDAHGLRFAPLHWISKKARIYDAYSPLGRQIYFKHVKRGLLDKGVDALWMDGTEVEVGTAAWNPDEVERDIKRLGDNALGDFTRYLNPYSLMTTQGVYDGERRTSAKRVFTLTRSAWAGAQRTAAASWSGDIFANWKTLREQISGGVNVTITGNPYWTQDTGGFFVTDFPGGEKNPAYQELFARWFQFGAFNPIMRVHGTSIEREPYIFEQLNPDMYRSLLNTVHLRYRLLPYIYSLAWKVTSGGYTLMRALPMDFPDDRATHDIDDAFMFGPALLVHPVTRPMFHIQNPPPGTVPASALVTPDGAPGLAGQYFAGTNFETAAGRTVDAKIDMNWPEPPLAVLPPGLQSLNDFSARWQGELIPPEDGEYEIGLQGDDGYRLFLDGKLVVEDWVNGAKRYNGTTIALQKGKPVKLTIEYFQGGGGRSLRLAWRTPSEIKALRENKPSVDLTMRTYLPRGAGWYDFWTGQFFEGGQTVAKETPLDILPLYVRAGSIVPMGPEVQYATEAPDAPYELRVYPGADGSFTMYEDDNETYAYEKGVYATYDIRWHDASRTLTIGPRRGKFNAVKKRDFEIVLPPAKGATAPRRLRITYNGTPLTRRLD